MSDSNLSEAELRHVLRQLIQEELQQKDSTPDDEANPAVATETTSTSDDPQEVPGYLISKLDSLGSEISDVKTNILNVRHEVNSSSIRAILLVSAFFSLLTGIMAWLGVQSLSNNIENSILDSVNQSISTPVAELRNETTLAQTSVSTLIDDLEGVDSSLKVVSSDMTNLGTNIATIKSDVEEVNNLSEQITQIQADIQGLQSIVRGGGIGTNANAGSGVSNTTDISELMLLLAYALDLGDLSAIREVADSLFLRYDLLSPNQLEDLSSTFQFVIEDSERAIVVATEGILRLERLEELDEEQTELLGELYQNRAAAFQAQDRFEFALEDYGRALDLNPNDTTALNNRQSVYFVENEFELADGDLRAAIEIEPDDEDLLLNYAILYLAWAQSEDKSPEESNELLQMADGFGSRGFELAVASGRLEGKAAFILALTNTLLGERATALNWLDTAYQYAPERAVLIAAQDAENDYEALLQIAIQYAP